MKRRSFLSVLLKPERSLPPPATNTREMDHEWTRLMFETRERYVVQSATGVLPPRQELKS